MANKKENKKSKKDGKFAGASANAKEVLSVIGKRQSRKGKMSEAIARAQRAVPLAAFNQKGNLAGIQRLADQLERGAA